MAHIAERMTSHYQAGRRCGYEVTDLPRARPDRRVPARGATRTSCSACPACGRRSTPACRRRWPPTPRRRSSSTRRSRRRCPIVERRAVGPGHRRGQDATCEFLDEVAFSAVRELLGLDELRARHHRRRADPAPSCSSWFRAIGVPLSEVYGMSENIGPDDAGPPCEVEARHRRPGDSRAARCSWPTTARSSAGAATCSSATSTTPRRRPRRSTTTAGCTPATSASSTTTATSDRRPQEGADHHRRRQEHQPGQPRGRAEDDPAGRPGRARSATSGRSSSALVVLDPEVAPVWAKQHGIDVRRPRRARRAPRGGRRGRARPRRGDGAVQQRRAGEEGEGSSARSGCPTPRCSRRPRSSSGAASCRTTTRSRRSTPSSELRSRDWVAKPMSEWASSAAPGSNTHQPMAMPGEGQRRAEPIPMGHTLACGR